MPPPPNTHTHTNDHLLRLRSRRAASRVTSGARSAGSNPTQPSPPLRYPSRRGSSRYVCGPGLEEVFTSLLLSLHYHSYHFISLITPPLCFHFIFLRFVCTDISIAKTGSGQTNEALTSTEKGTALHSLAVLGRGRGVPCGRDCRLSAGRPGGHSISLLERV